MIETILHSHLSRYPTMQIQDLYKLLHQAALGSEHAVRNLEAARNWLTRELAEMGADPSEPLIDPISPDGKIVRVHLRPFVAAGHNPDVLLHAFRSTANEHYGDATLLEEFWQAAVIISKFPAVEMEGFILSMKEQNFPAVHHSSKYEQLYRPAYRVVALAFCPPSWGDFQPNL